LNSIVDGNTNSQRFSAYFDLLEGQTLSPTQAEISRLSQARQTLEKLGYRIYTLPSPYSQSGWAGLSYVNSLVIGQDLMIPSFGLSSYENKLMFDLKSAIPDFNVHFIPSLIQIVKNGGLH